MQNTTPRLLLAQHLFARAIARQWLKNHTSRCVWMRQKNSSNHAMQRFAAVIIRIRDPKTTALVFASGKMVRVLGVVVAKYRSLLLARMWCNTQLFNKLCGKQVVTGAKSEQASLLAAKKVLAVMEACN